MLVYLKKGIKGPLEHPEHGGLMVPNPDTAYDELDPLVLAHPRSFAPREEKPDTGKSKASADK